MRVSFGAMRSVVAFDLDGTLLRGQTVCEVLARAVGRVEEARAFEGLRDEASMAAGRLAMAEWYRGVPEPKLLSALESAAWAPGVPEGLSILRQAGCEVVIASITWRFAVRWFAERWGVSRYLGTELTPEGGVRHVWPRDKGAWLRGLARELAVPQARVAAVGDSSGDVELWQAASLRVCVGAVVPPGLVGVQHRANASIDAVAREIVDLWCWPLHRPPRARPVT
jgi:phosphoserine phosphatase